LPEVIVMTQRLAVFIDYQNVHLTAHGLFTDYGQPVHLSLMDPLRLSELIAAKRRMDSHVAAVKVFRGRPNPQHHPRATAANDAQTAA
jgi:hypothetical protein